MALKIKEVPPSVVGQKGTRSAYAVYDGSELVYKTKRGGGQGTAMYGFTEEKAAELLAKEEARRAEEGSAAPKKKKKAASPKRSTSRTAAKAPRPARKKLDRQELTVDSCRSFLEGRGYEVSFSERSALAMLQPGFVGNPRKRRRKNRDSRSSAYYSVAISKAHSLMMKEHNKTDNYADFVGIGYRRMSENPRLYLAHAVAESNAILNSRASASSKKAARQVIKAITDLHPELAQFESRSRSGIRKFNPRKNPGHALTTYEVSWSLSSDPGHVYEFTVRAPYLDDALDRTRRKLESLNIDVLVEENFPDEDALAATLWREGAGEHGALMIIPSAENERRRSRAKGAKRDSKGRFVKRKNSSLTDRGSRREPTRTSKGIARRGEAGLVTARDRRRSEDRAYVKRLRAALAEFRVDRAAAEPHQTGWIAFLDENIAELEAELASYGVKTPRRKTGRRKRKNPRALRRLR
jgi:hypothetical protein